MGSPRARATGRCPRCAVRREHCICAVIATPIATRAQIVLIRHAREVWRPTNTARIAAEALGGARLVEYGVLGVPLDVPALLAELPKPVWLLYPAVEGEDTPQPAPGSPPPGALVVVDGSWSQTQRFVRRHPELYALPRCALDDEIEHRAPRSHGAGASLRLRHARDPVRRLTAEAIAGYLTQWEGPAVGEALLRVHRAFVAATLAGRGDQVPAGWVEGAADRPSEGWVEEE